MLLVAAGIAAAQQESVEEKIRQQAAEVSRLMRESERLLLELTRVDRLVETQKQVEDELKKLLPPDQGGVGGAGGAGGAERRAQLEQQQKEIGRKIEEMLAGEKQMAAAAAKQIEELLQNLPREQVAQPQSGGGNDKKPQEQEKRLRDKDKEDRKQHQPQSDQPQQPRDPNDKSQRPEKRPREQDPAAARLDRIQAWIAKLPPEDQERINRNDYSRVPARYRHLVEEVTARRAARAAEEKEEDR
jgi:hypothetical protein